MFFLFMCFSEKFMVRLNKNGGPKNPEKVDRLCALFTVTHTHTHTHIYPIQSMQVVGSLEDL